MPYRKKYKNRKLIYGKKKYKKKGKKNYGKLIKNPTGFARAMYTKLKWSVNASYTTGTLTDNRYVINSLYDPGSSFWSS